MPRPQTYLLSPADVTMTQSRARELRLAALLKEKNELLAQREKLLADLRSLDLRIGHISSVYGKVHNEELPISKLPSELLHMVLRVMRADTDPSEDFSMRPEIIFSAVCSRWRRATLSFADLWNSFRTRHPSELAYHRLIAYLERSGMLPVDLWFDFKSVGPHDLPDGFHLLRESMKHVHRWRSFTVLTEIETPILFLATGLSDKEAPLLETLILLANRPSSGFDPTDTNVALSISRGTSLTGGTPKLHYICLNELGGSVFLPPITTISDLRLDMHRGKKSGGSPSGAQPRSPSPRSQSSDSGRYRRRRRRRSSGERRAGSDDESEDEREGRSGSPQSRKTEEVVEVERERTDSAPTSAASSLGVVTGASIKEKGILTPDPSVYQASGLSRVVNGEGEEVTADKAKPVSAHERNMINLQTAAGVLLLSVAAAAVIWKVKPE
ncbi:hypothetical protein NMY22_g14900 [Coprinellus aureogranulatus]|nr:hypothetical protein NMY22_g14900 [Coprinellus aureogranulatus]